MGEPVLAIHALPAAISTLTGRRPTWIAPDDVGGGDDVLLAAGRLGRRSRDRRGRRRRAGRACGVAGLVGEEEGGDGAGEDGGRRGGPEDGPAPTATRAVGPRHGGGAAPPAAGCRRALGARGRRAPGRREGRRTELAGRGGTRFRPLLQRSANDLVERRRHPGHELRGLGRRGVQVRPQTRLVGLPRVGGLPGQREVQHASERVDVGAPVDGLAADLLGRHEVHRPDPAAGRGQPAFGERVAREAEVAEVDLVVGAEQDVGGLDVAVDEPGIVRGVERVGHMGHDRRRVLRRERPGGGDPLAQIVAVDEPHGDVRPSVALAVVVDRDDVGVLDRRRGTRLAQEALANAWIAEQPGRDDLQRDGTVETQLRGLVDDAHTAATGDAFHPVTGELRGGWSEHGDVPGRWGVPIPCPRLERPAPRRVPRLQLLWMFAVRPTAPPRDGGGAARRPRSRPPRRRARAERGRRGRSGPRRR